MDSIFQKSRQQPELGSFFISLYTTLMPFTESGFFHLTTSRNNQEFIKPLFCIHGLLLFEVLEVCIFQVITGQDEISLTTGCLFTSCFCQKAQDNLHLEKYCSISRHLMHPLL